MENQESHLWGDGFGGAVGDVGAGPKRSSESPTARLHLIGCLFPLLHYARGDALSAAASRLVRAAKLRPCGEGRPLDTEQGATSSRSAECRILLAAGSVSRAS